MTTALVLIADGSEEIEAVTAIDILRRAQVEVTVASVKQAIDVHCSRGVNLKADTTLTDLAGVATSFSAIILPGGLQAAKTFSSDEMVQRLLKEYEAKGKLVAAMCASTTALRAAGVGEGKRATSYPGVKEQLGGFYNYQEMDVVVDEQLITSRAPGTAMAWAMTIVEVLCGKDKASGIASGILFKLH